MFRFCIRVLGFLLLAAGFAALVIDGTRSIAASNLVMARFGELCAWLLPKAFPLLQPAVERNIHPLLWDPVLRGFFLTPAWIVLSALGLMLILIVKRRRLKVGFSSRP